MTNGPKTSEIVEPPTVFALTCGLISLVLLAFLIMRYASSSTLMDQVREIAVALSPFLTFLTVVVAVVGWGETAPAGTASKHGGQRVLLA